MTDEFWDSEGGEWSQTASGSFVRAGGSATVFPRGGGWRGVSNVFNPPCFTRRQRDTPEEAAELVIAAEQEGAGSTLWSSPGTTAWGPAKPKKGLPGFWRKRHGVNLTVRQCAPRDGYPPSWIAHIAAGEQVLAANGKPWFASAAEAMMAADAEYERRARAGGQGR